MANTSALGEVLKLDILKKDSSLHKSSNSQARNFLELIRQLLDKWCHGGFRDGPKRRELNELTLIIKKRLDKTVTSRQGAHY